MGDGVEDLEKTKFLYVGERSFWKYKNSGWGMVIPRVDSERLKISKNSVARIFVSYDKRLILIRVIDTHVHDKKLEEEVLSIVQGSNMKKEEIERVIEQLKKIVEEEKQEEVKKKKTTRKKAEKSVEAVAGF